VKAQKYKLRNETLFYQVSEEMGVPRDEALDVLKSGYAQMRDLKLELDDEDHQVAFAIAIRILTFDRLAEFNAHMLHNLTLNELAGAAAAMCIEHEVADEDVIETDEAGNVVQ